MLACRNSVVILILCGNCWLAVAKAPPAKPKTDRYGDVLPAGAGARLGTVRFRNGAGIFLLEFSPDGKTLASAGGSPWAQQGVQSADCTIRLWDVVSGKEIRTLKGHNAGVLSMAFAPDGKKLAASVAQDPNIRIWDLDKTQEPMLYQVSANTGFPIALSFSPDSNSLLISANGETPHTIRIVNVGTSKEVRTIGKHQAWIESLALSPDGKIVATKSSGIIYLWKEATGELIQKIRPRLYYAKQRQLAIEQGASMQGSSAAIRFSPDSKLLAFEAGDNTVHLWDVAGDKEQTQLVHRGPVVSMSFAPDSKSLVTGCQDNTLRLWDLSTGKERLHLEGHFGGYMAVTFAPNGKSFASAGGDHSVRLWNAVDGSELLPQSGHQGEVFGGAFSKDGKDLMTFGRDNTLRFWDVAARKQIRQFVHRDEPIDRVVFSRDRTLVALGSDVAETIRVMRVDSGQQFHEFQGRPFMLAFSPDGKQLGSIGIDAKLSVWDLATGKESRPFDNRAEVLTGFVFAQEANQVVIGTAENQFKRWNLAQSAEILTFETLPEMEPLITFSISRDGKYLATIHPNNIIHLWNAITGKHLHKMQHASEPTLSNMNATVVFSPDSKTLATAGSGDNAVRLWEVATGKERRHFEGHRGPVSFVTFSLDGKSLASGSWDTTVLIWELTGMPVVDRVAVQVDEEQQWQQWWTQLAGDDAAQANQAQLAMSAQPDRAVQFLGQKVRPVAPVSAPQLAALIKSLDRDDFNVRQQASAELTKLGPLALPALQAALQGETSLETRRRVEFILEGLTKSIPTADQLRTIRVIELLERIDSPASLQLLKTLAQGAANAFFTVEAQAALERKRRTS